MVLVPLTPIVNASTYPLNWSVGLANPTFRPRPPSEEANWSTVIFAFGYVAR